MRSNDIIKTMIEEKGMSVYDFSKATGIPKSTIYDITSGKNSIYGIRVEQFIKIAEGLGVSADYLIEVAIKDAEED